MSTEDALPLSNTPDHLNWLADHEPRKGRAFLKVDGSSKVFDAKELDAAGSLPEMFKEEWEPMIHDDSLVGKTPEQLAEDAQVAEAEEFQRQLALAAENDRKLMKIIVVCGAVFLGVCVLVVLALLLRGKPADGTDAQAAQASSPVETTK